MDKKQLNPILIIFSLGLALRLFYFLLSLQELGIENYFSSVSDTDVYWTIAQHLLDYADKGEYWIFQVGAGYGVVIALVYSLFNKSLYALYFFHIIVGSLIPLIIYQIANRLFDNRRVAFLSGIFCAVSLTGVTLSCNITSDIMFVLIFSTALWWYIIGLQSEKIIWFIGAGLLAGISAYIRAVTILYPFIFLIIPFTLLNLRDFTARIQILKKSLVVVGIMLLMILSWSARNYYVNDVFTFGANGVKSARVRLAALAVSERTEGLSYADINVEWSNQDSAVFNYETPTFAEEYKRDLEHFIIILKENPDWILAQFVENIYRNMVTGNYIPTLQIKSMGNIWNVLAEINKYIFGPLLYLLTFAGLIILYRCQKYMILSILGLHYLYFTLITGFSMWQGTRLHFPAEISFTILSAFVVWEITMIVQSKGKTG